MYQMKTATPIPTVNHPGKGSPKTLLKNAWSVLKDSSIAAQHQCPELIWSRSGVYQITTPPM